MLLKQQKVLTMTVFNSTPPEGCDVVEFGDEDTDVVFDMPVLDWVDMGRPETITLTVEPGDLLNE